MRTLDFNPFPVIETPRLLLRRPLPSDAADLLVMRSDPEVMQFIPRPLAKTEEDVLVLLRMLDEFTDRNERINWGIEWKESGRLIGMIGFVHIHPEHSRAEVGYSLTRAWHRKGIMREALSAVLEFGFREWELHSVLAIIDAENKPSGSLLVDAGFRQEAHFLEDFCHDCRYRNSIHYGMLHHEFRPLLPSSGA